MSLAIVRHCRSNAPFCRGTCGEMVVSLALCSNSNWLICLDVRSPALSVCILRTVTLCELQHAMYCLIALNASDLLAKR
eukprot:1307311-Pleurochrysis_carterae.AAC.5